MKSFERRMEPENTKENKADKDFILEEKEEGRTAEYTGVAGKAARVFALASALAFAPSASMARAQEKMPAQETKTGQTDKTRTFEDFKEEFKDLEKRVEKIRDGHYEAKIKELKLRGSIYDWAGPKASDVKIDFNKKGSVLRMSFKGRTTMFAVNLADWVKITKDNRFDLPAKEFEEYAAVVEDLRIQINRLVIYENIEAELEREGKIKEALLMRYSTNLGKEEIFDKYGDILKKW